MAAAGLQIIHYYTGWPRLDDLPSNLPIFRLAGAGWPSFCPAPLAVIIPSILTDGLIRSPTGGLTRTWC
jgi:hypothetical protein